MTNDLPAPQPAPRLRADDVQWIVNDLAELGVMIHGQAFFLYKGHSLVYEDATHDETGEPMRYYRPVFKREFGECAHPINYDDPTLIGTVSLDDSDEWRELPPAIPSPEGALPIADGFDRWWAAHSIHRVLSPGGFARMVWEASARHNRKTVLGATDSTSGFYPEDEGSTPSGQATPSPAEAHEIPAVHPDQAREELWGLLMPMAIIRELTGTQHQDGYATVEAVRSALAANVQPKGTADEPVARIDSPVQQQRDGLYRAEVTLTRALPQFTDLYSQAQAPAPAAEPWPGYHDDIAAAIGELSHAMGSPTMMARRPASLLSATVRAAAERIKSQSPAVGAEPATREVCGRSYVEVRTEAVDWLKKHYPALCEKSGLCERIGGRLYTRSVTPAPKAAPLPLERPLTGCAAGKDGDCTHSQCPQLRDGEPSKTGRHCPLDSDVPVQHTGGQ